MASASRDGGMIGPMPKGPLGVSIGLNRGALTTETAIVVREASPGDNSGLVALTSATPMLGAISLRIDRGPDFFRLLDLRGKGKVFVATDRGRVIGCISAAVRTAFVSGTPQTIGYIGDVKVHPSFAGSRVVLRLIAALREDLIRRNVDLLFAVIAAGNRQALSLMEGRLGTPRWRQIGSFRVCEFLPSPFAGRSNAYDIGPVRPNERGSLVALVNGFNRGYQFGPEIAPEDANPAPFARTLVARAGREVVATLTAFDTAEVKSNVVVALPPSLQAALAALYPLRLVLPRLRIPSVGEPLRLLYLRNAAHRKGHERALRALIQRARFEAYEREYSFAVLGIHERDPLSAIVKGLPKFVFSTHAFATSLVGGHDLEAIAAGIPMEDFALV